MFPADWETFMRIRTALAFCILAVQPALGHVFFMSGEDLRRGLVASQRADGGTGTDNDKVLASRTAGFIMGVQDAMASEEVVCTPSNVSLSNVVLTVSEYLDKNPIEPDGRAVTIVREALRDVFPCDAEALN